MMKCVATIDQAHFSVDSVEVSDVENLWLPFFLPYAMLTSQYDLLSITQHDCHDDEDENVDDEDTEVCIANRFQSFLIGG